VLVFQTFAGQAGLVFLLPVYMYLFVVALGTDYNILMIARLREQAQHGMAPRQAAADAVRHAGPAIGSAGLILSGTFASLILAGNSILQQIGFAVAAGIALAAFVMAMFFSPSLTGSDRQPRLVARPSRRSSVTSLIAIMRPGGPAASRRWRTRWR
jgi:RND superfamily putative drug exporter